MEAITVENIFVNVCKDTNLGYIKIIETGAESKAEERGAETLTAVEMANLMKKEAKAFYMIGSYWNIVI